MIPFYVVLTLCSLVLPRPALGQACDVAGAATMPIVANATHIEANGIRFFAPCDVATWAAANPTGSEVVLVCRAESEGAGFHLLHWSLSASLAAEVHDIGDFGTVINAAAVDSTDGTLALGAAGQLWLWRVGEAPLSVRVARGDDIATVSIHRGIVCAVTTAGNVGVFAIQKGLRSKFIDTKFASSPDAAQPFGAATLCAVHSRDAHATTVVIAGTKRVFRSTWRYSQLLPNASTAEVKEEATIVTTGVPLAIPTHAIVLYSRPVTAVVPPHMVGVWNATRDVWLLSMPDTLGDCTHGVALPSDPAPSHTMAYSAHVTLWCGAEYVHFTASVSAFRDAASVSPATILNLLLFAVHAALLYCVLPCGRA